MQNAAMFGAIITVSFATMNINSWTEGQPDVETSRYYGNTLASLRRALTMSNEVHEDATILAILSLIRFEYLVGNVQAYHTHSMALQGLIAQRSGTDGFDWSGIVVPAVAGAMTRAKFFSKVSKTKLQPTPLAPGSARHNELKPYSPLDFAERTLPPGIQLLVDTGRLSGSAIRLARAAFQNPEIDIRHNNTAVKNAYNTELTEHLEYLLCSETLSLADEILMIAIHRELHELASNERYSILHRDFVIHWTYRALRMIKEVQADDIPLVEVFVWLCFKLAGTMVAPFLNMVSADTDDPRFQLMLRVVEKFEQGTNWLTVDILLMRFEPMRECFHWWHLIWQSIKLQHKELTMY